MLSLNYCIDFTAPYDLYLPAYTHTLYLSPSSSILPPPIVSHLEGSSVTFSFPFEALYVTYNFRVAIKLLRRIPFPAGMRGQGNDTDADRRSSETVVHFVVRWNRNAH